MHDTDRCVISCKTVIYVYLKFKYTHYIAYDSIALIEHSIQSGFCLNVPIIILTRYPRTSKG